MDQIYGNPLNNQKICDIQNQVKSEGSLDLFFSFARDNFIMYFKSILLWLVWCVDHLSRIILWGATSRKRRLLLPNLMRGFSSQLCMYVVLHNYRSIQRLEVILSRLRQNNMEFEPSKCILFRKSVKCLGHVLSSDWVKTDFDEKYYLTTHIF